MRGTDQWRLRIEHTTRFCYSSPVRSSYNEVRLLPQTNERQSVLGGRVVTLPSVAQYAYRDYWGTDVVAFNVDPPHQELEIASVCLVETQPPAPPADVSWWQLTEAKDRFAEMLAPTPFTTSEGALTEAAADVRQARPVDTVVAVAGWLEDHLEYVPGVTGVHTSAVEAYEAGRGVCQDFAHVALAMLRSAGVPARYVSGYFHHEPDAHVGDEVPGESHAWVEVWLGDWWALDPTNKVDVGPRHVVVARGRDYGDVAPIKGIYAGGAERDMAVEVRMVRMR